jgi:hypothetical protein
MKPSFVTLKSHHASSNLGRAGYVHPIDLYKDIGYDMNDLYHQDPGYQNTCAVRMSLALIKSGVAISGRLKIKAGPYKGRMIEPGAKLLADQLMRASGFGRPLILQDRAESRSKLARQQGLVFFWKIDGYGGGHIDLIEPANGSLLCNSDCFFNCKEVWFWSMS